MKIGIDTFACNGGKSGVGIYLTQLLKRLPPSGDRYELFGWAFDRFAYSEAAPDMEFIPRCSINGSTANSLWHLVRYQEFAKNRGYDGCFFPAAHRQFSPRSSCPSIGTVHDMEAYWGTRKTRKHLGAILRMVLPNSLRKLDRIIAVSRFVKQELMDLVRVKESRIEVIPNGVDLAAFYPRPRNEESVVLIQPFSFRRPYILFVSRIDHPVKNHIRLIEAFGIFKERTRYPHRLVLAGGGRHGVDKVKEAAANSSYKNDIFFTGYFPVENLPALYAAADMVVIPSMYEGSGMGVLEAMASGVPVVCARAASLPEAAEHAALYFDPRDAEDMADRMVALATNRDLHRECRALGIERAQSFSWDRCAERTLAVIQETVAK
ncbi:MAG: glycosyltransferase family 4 protein [Spirochaetaceae bacterium]|nr:glycosyltransferase family 4 protein [Spirochaetaceae bacterium]